MLVWSTQPKADRGGYSEKEGREAGTVKSKWLSLFSQQVLLVVDKLDFCGNKRKSELSNRADASARKELSANRSLQL